VFVKLSFEAEENLNKHCQGGMNWERDVGKSNIVSILKIADEMEVN
jgi:hypothetical protein